MTDCKIESLAGLRLLRLLAEAKGETVTREVIAQQVFRGGPDKINDTVTRVRKAIGDDAIVTEYGVGYRFTLPVVGYYGSGPSPKFLDDLIAPYLVNTSYFGLSNPPDIFEERNAIEVLLHSRAGEVRFAPPPEAKARDIITEIMASHEHIANSDPDYENWYSYYLRAVRNGYQPEETDHVPFAKADIIPRLAGEGTKVFRSFLADQVRLDATKDAQLRAYLLSNACNSEIKRLGNGFGFNGLQFALCNLSVDPDGDKPVPKLTVELRYTDYFSYRLTAENATAIYAEHGLKELLKPGAGEGSLWDYCRSGFQQLVHSGFGIGVMVHTLTDNKLIVTIRSDYAADFRDANKLAMSANESVNSWDLRPDEDFLPFESIVNRAVNEELFSKQKLYQDADPKAERRESLWDRSVRCRLVGALIYFPNLSCSLIFMLSVNCDSEHVRYAWARAPHGKFSAKRIVDDLPDCSVDGIAQFIAKTLRDPETGKMSTNRWDEGSLVALRLCGEASEVNPF